MAVIDDVQVCDCRLWRISSLVMVCSYYYYYLCGGGGKGGFWGEGAGQRGGFDL